MEAITVSHGSPMACAMARIADVLPVPGAPESSTGTRAATATPSASTAGLWGLIPPVWRICGTRPDFQAAADRARRSGVHVKRHGVGARRAQGQDPRVGPARPLHRDDQVSAGQDQTGRPHPG